MFIQMSKLRDIIVDKIIIYLLFRQIYLESGVIFLAKIIAEGTEPVEVILKRFKRECEKEGIIREWRKKQYYEKPSEIKKLKKKAVERKRLKKLRKMSRTRRRK